MLENGALSFFPILSSTKTPTCDMAKLCNRVLKLLIGNDYSLKDSFSFDRQVIGRTQYIIFHDKFEPFRRTFGEETELYSNHSDVNFLISFRLEPWCYIETFLGNFCEKKKNCWRFLRRRKLVSSLEITHQSCDPVNDIINCHHFTRGRYSLYEFQDYTISISWNNRGGCTPPFLTSV